MNKAFTRLDNERLSVFQMVALTFVAENPGCREVEAAKRFRRPSSQINLLFIRLVAEGWLSREMNYNPEARRATPTYTVTSATKKLIADIRRIARND